MNDYPISIIFVGDKEVGKTRLIKRIISQLNTDTKETIIGSFINATKVSFTFDVENTKKTINLTLIDTPGIAQFQEFILEQVKQANIAFVVCNEKSDTLERAGDWVSLLQPFKEKGLKIGIIRNNIEQRNNKEDITTIRGEDMSIPTYEVFLQEEDFNFLSCVNYFIEDLMKHPFTKNKIKILQKSSNNKCIILFCPICKVRIPEIEVIVKEKDIKCQIKCECKKEPFIYDYETLVNICKEIPNSIEICNANPMHNSQKLIALFYCMDCEKWCCKECYNSKHRPHSVSSFKFKLNKKCPNAKHRDSNLVFCEMCMKYECQKCGQENKNDKKDVKSQETFQPEIDKVRKSIDDFLKESNLSNRISLERNNKQFYEILLQLNNDYTKTEFYDINIEKNFNKNLELYQKFNENIRLEVDKEKIDMLY